MKFKSLLFALVCLITMQSFSQEWLTDFNEAKKQASANKQHIVLVFQGSDWCAPCMKLEKEIWNATEFQELSKDKFVFLKADFPRRKQNKLSEAQQEHNAALAERYNPNGFFPLVVVLDQEGKVLGKLGYDKSTPSEYFKKLSAF